MRVEVSLLVAAQNVLGFGMVVANPAIEQIELLIQTGTSRVCQFGNMLQRDQHMLPHYDLLLQRDFVVVQILQRCQNGLRTQLHQH